MTYFLLLYFKLWYSCIATPSRICRLLIDGVSIVKPNDSCSYELIYKVVSMLKRLSYEDKITMLKYNISRFDHYYASVNFKSSFLVVGNITILGFLLTNVDKVNVCFSILHFLLVTLSLTFTLLAIKPYLESYKSKKSLVYFEDIANMEYTNFSKKISTSHQTTYIKDLKEQNFILAKGLKNKFDYLNRSTIIFVMNIVMFFLNAFFIVIKDLI